MELLFSLNLDGYKVYEIIKVITVCVIERQE